LNWKERRTFKVRVEDATPEIKRDLARARAEHAEAVLESTRWQDREVVTPDQKAGPFEGHFTAQLLVESEIGMTTVRAMIEMKQAEEYCVHIGAWEHHSPYYTSICEALRILRPQP
jgi:hypothetical protein